MSFIIESEISDQYLREPNAVEGFRQAVENGQVRLALQILVDIVDAFSDIFEAVTEDEEEATLAVEASEEVLTAKETPVEEPIKPEQKTEEPKKPANKKVVEEKPDTQEV